MLGLDIAYMHSKFYHSSFDRFGAMVGAHQNLNGSCDLTMPISGTVCHPWDSTSYHQPIYQIWSLYLYPLRRYERQYNIAKVTQNSAIRWGAYEFLLVFNSNHAPILHRFWDIARCWSKIADLNLPHLYLAPP